MVTLIWLYSPQKVLRNIDSRFYSDNTAGNTQGTKGLCSRTIILLRPILIQAGVEAILFFLSVFFVFIFFF